MATVTNYPIDLPILVIEAQICVAVKKFQFLPNKLIPSNQALYRSQLTIIMNRDGIIFMCFDTMTNTPVLQLLQTVANILHNCNL